MDLERKKGDTARNGVIAGSVWETRMKNDDVKGGFKVFNGDQNSQENVTFDHNNNNNSTANNSEIQVYKRLRPKQSALAGANAGKRKTWNSENSDGVERSPVHISKQRSEKEKIVDGKCGELSVSPDGIKRSPVQTKKTRSEAGKELSVSVDGFDTITSPIHQMRTRAMWQRLSGEYSDGIGRNSISLRKLKSDPSKVVEEGSVRLSKSKSEGNERNSIGPVKGIGRNSVEHIEESVQETEKNPVGIKDSRSAESLDEFDVCDEKVITTDLDNSGQVKFDDDEEDEDDWDEEMEEAVEEKIEKNSIVVKEMNVSSEETKPISPVIKKQISTPVVVAEKKILQRNERAAPISTLVRKQSPSVVNHPRFISKPTNTNPTQESDESQKVPRTHSKLQSLVDLVMWRDASKSAFIFGIGTFSIISSSYTKDLNISLISVISYLGLVYLAAIFIFRSIINRGAVDTDDENQDHVVGEEEAIWVLKLILPYINEFLLNVRALFSGDPATTMKLAVLLFVLARCGSSITIWKMVKLGFFGVFTVPKVCSSYSPQLTAFGTFWVRRFRDAWESCTHKKGVAFAIFTVVWNLSSVVARIWAVFMLFVAFKYYKQSLMMKEEWMDEDDASVTGEVHQDPWQGQRQRRPPGPTFMLNSQKLKKGS